MDSTLILAELKRSISTINDQDVHCTVTMLLQANHIFCDGLGRSGLCCRAFAMRLMQLGLDAFFVGDTMTPAIQEKDLLLICSGSGASPALVSRAQKARQLGAKVALITGRPASPLEKLADSTIFIAAPTKDECRNTASIMPMGSLFEDTSSLLFENMVMQMMDKLGETSQTMLQRHANLE